MIFAKDCFPTSTYSVYEALGLPTQGFVIPSYQRRYAWSSKNLAQLVDDIANGLDTLVRSGDPNNFTYIGTMITTDGRGLLEAGGCDPIPSKVTEIVDGQQRASTLGLISLAILRHLSEKLAKYQSNRLPTAAEAKDRQFLISLIQKTIRGLEDVVLTRRHGLLEQRFPKLIRISEDRWLNNGSTDAGSPIAHLVKQQLLSNANFTAYTSPKKYEGTNHERQRIGELSFAINDFISDIDQLNTDDEDGLGFSKIPSFEEVVESKSCLNFVFDDLECSPTKLSTPDSDLKNEMQQVIRLCTFAHYMLHRVALTVVDGKTENFALEVFQSLNTSGVPLNAYETFKPSVIRRMNPANYAGSDEQTLFQRIDQCFQRPNTDEKKRRLVEETIVSFAMAHDGTKVGRKLSDQHRFFRASYLSVNGSSDTDTSRYLHLLGTTAEVMHLYHSGNLGGYSRLSEIFNADDDTKICFSLVADIRHSIVLPIIALFFDRYELERNGEAQGNTVRSSTIRGILKAITAFSVLWRCAFGGTNGIDAIYRRITAQVREVPEEQRTLEVFKGLLLRQLENTSTRRGGPFPSKVSWVSQARHTDFYALKSVSKFFLLLAHHDTVEDPGMAGQIKRGAKGCAPTFTYSNYVNDDLEKEHVYPQTPQDPDWPQQVLSDRRTINYLGNLIVVPKKVNLLLSNKSWAHKKAIFSILANPARDKNLGEARNEILDFDPEVLQEAAHLTGAAAISLVEKWDSGLIERRGVSLLEQGYDRLIQWLK